MSDFSHLANVFACSKEQARLVAECANLRQIQTSAHWRSELWDRYNAMVPYPTMSAANPDDPTETEYEEFDGRMDEWTEGFAAWRDAQDIPESRLPFGHDDRWEDRATGGGGGRICWMRGVAWVTRHSGYDWADITDEICELFVDLGCRQYRGWDAPESPWIYDRDRSERSLANAEDTAFVAAVATYRRQGD